MKPCFRQMNEKYLSKAKPRSSKEIKSKDSFKINAFLKHPYINSYIKSEIFRSPLVIAIVKCNEEAFQ